MSFHHVCEGLRRSGNSEALVSFMVKYGRMGESLSHSTGEVLESGLDDVDISGFGTDQFSSEAETLVKFSK